MVLSSLLHLNLALVSVLFFLALSLPVGIPAGFLLVLGVPVGLRLVLVPAGAGLRLFLTLYVFLIFTWPLGILGDEVLGCSELQLGGTDRTPASLFCPGSSNSSEDEEGTGRVNRGFLLLVFTVS